jgi:hypothetical protein
MWHGTIVHLGKMRNRAVLFFSPLSEERSSSRLVAAEERQECFDHKKHGWKGVFFCFLGWGG